MALDPQAANVIDLIVKSGRPPYHELTPKDARQMFRETRPASTPPAPQIGAVRDVLTEGAQAIPLRVYRPPGVSDSRRLPVLVYFHGGGWVIGDLETHDVLCRQLTAEAGGPRIALQILLYPVTDLVSESQSYADLADGYMLTRDSMRWFRAQYLAKEQDAADWRVSPLRAPSLAGLPPALVVTAGYDPLRDEGEAYARRLREAGVSVDAVSFGGMIHGFVPMGRLIDTAFRGVSLITGSLRQALR